MSLIEPLPVKVFRIVKSHSGKFLIGVVVVVVFSLGVVWVRSCSKPPKLNEKEIHDAQIAIEQHDEKKMAEVLARSDAREKVGDDITGNAEADTLNAIQESKKQWVDAGAQAMCVELERRAGKDGANCQ